MRKTIGRVEFIGDTDRAARIEALQMWWVKHKGNRHTVAIVYLLYVVWKDVIYPKVNDDEELVNDEDVDDDDDGEDEFNVGTSSTPIDRRRSYPIERRQRTKRGRRQLNLVENSTTTTSQTSIPHWATRWSDDECYICC